jgi:uncharacterized protein YndB with AHSA1/START domain
MANDKTPITIQALVNAPVEKVWQLWSNPEDIKQWNSASPDWHTPHATNDLRTGGSFTSRMEAKDGSFGFDFGGIYDAVEPHKHIAYTMGDGRQVKVDFNSQDGQTHIVETFDPESQNPVEMQQAGWQSILNNFKSYAESK